MKLLSKPSLKKLAFSGIVVLVVLIIAEIVLSLMGIIPDDYYVNTPDSGFTWEINNDEIIGIHQDSDVSFDELGARSISDYKDASHKIIVLGGSTAACFALTQGKDWPCLIEKKLDDQYWVGNFGRPGNNSNHHVFQLEQLLNTPKLKDTKTVVIMQGVNDLVAYLISKDQYLNLPEQKVKRFAFQHVPDDNLPWFKRLTLYKLAARAKKNIDFYFKHKDHLTKTVLDIRALRKQSKILDELPDVTEGLIRYEENIKAMIAIAKQKNVRLVFVTQATMWKPNLEPQYEELMLTSGFQNNEAFYSTTALYGGMEQFNQRLKTVCTQENIDCIDLQLPKTTASFYDDFHFNESGAELTAEQVSKQLKVLFSR